MPFLIKINPGSEYYVSGCNLTPSLYFPFNNTGSVILGAAKNNQWDCGSFCVFGQNQGFGVYVRKHEDKLKIDVRELNLLNESRKRIPPLGNYSGLHYQPQEINSIVVTFIGIDGRKIESSVFI